MLELLITRHAKSDWGTDADDHERPLSKRGFKAARKMGAFLVNAKRVPDVALSSTALRARTTADIMLEVAESSGLVVPRLSLQPELYGATVDEWLLCVGRELVNRQASRVLVAGHEPTCSSVLAALTGAWARFPTGSVAIVRVDDASQLAAPESHRTRCQLQAFIIPRLLG